MVVLISAVCLVATPVVAAAVAPTVTTVTTVSSAGATAASTAAAVAEGGALAAELATATTVTGAPAGAAVAAAATNPIGWAILGADANARVGVTLDCWKAVVHEEDPTPSKGRLMKVSQ